jgi:threonine dehydrogenase-like Zn-dependent dehydrogenase
MQQAMQVTRKGGYMSFVGVPHGVEIEGQSLFFSHIHLEGGPAPVRRYLPDLIDLVLSQKIDPSSVFDLVLPLAGGRRVQGDGRTPRDQGAAATVRMHWICPELMGLWKSYEMVLR